MVKNPKLIIEQVQKLHAKKEQSRDTVSESNDSVEKDMKKALGEENRLLEAYREGIISIEQLKAQMAKIQDRKDKLTDKQQLLMQSQQNVIPFSLAKKSIQDYCKIIEKRLNDIKDNFEDKRYLLELAINQIVVEENTLIIKGIVPVDFSEKPNLGSIASTASLW
ncbi:MAG: hypothetical protein AB1454_09855 [Candidatus Auribacterota bacterium]